MTSPMRAQEKVSLGYFDTVTIIKATVRLIRELYCFPCLCSDAKNNGLLDVCVVLEDLRSRSRLCWDGPCRSSVCI